MRRTTLFFSLVTLAALCLPARALIDIKDPLEKKIYAGSQSVFSGTVSAINTENHVLTVKPVTQYKGPALAGDFLQVQVEAPADLREKVHTGDPIVLFQSPAAMGRQAVAFHVADHWYGGLALSKPGTFRISAALSRDHDESFPGTTSDLVKLLGEIKAGKSTYLDAFPDIKLPALQKAGKLPADASAFAAVVLPGQDAPTFLVATSDGIKTFTLAADKSIKAAKTDLPFAGKKSAPLAAASSPTSAIVAVDGDLYSFSKTGRVKMTLKFPDTPILAAAISANPPAMMLLTAKGIHRAALSQDKTKPQQLTLSDSDSRLTGTLLTEYYPAHSKGFTAASMTAVDINHDGRSDLIVVTPQGTLTLLDRGFGGYLVNKDFAAPLIDPAIAAKGLPLIASTPGTLWMLQKDGTLMRCDFPSK